MNSPERSPYTLNDFREQLEFLTQHRDLQNAASAIPGIGDIFDGSADESPEKLVQSIFGIIDSMTPAEKHDPKLIDRTRRSRIAACAGVQPHQVNELIKMFEPMRLMITEMAGKGGESRQRLFNQLKQAADRPEPPMPWNPRG